MELHADYHLLRHKLEKFEIPTNADEPTLANVRRLLLVARDELPEDALVFELFQRYVLQPISEAEREFFRASRRVCLIERERAGESTGILVGPDLMLTAAHSLRGSASVFADPALVTIRFDEFFWADGRRADGETCRIATDRFTGEMEVLASSVRADPTGATLPQEGPLDYVLVRLDRQIGTARLKRSSTRLRGWMDGSAAEEGPEGDVAVLQHPDGRLLKLSRGSVPAGGARNGARFRYQIEVNGGASGAPILNARKQLVGMHVGIEPDGSAIGINFQAIFADLRDRDVQLPRFPPRKEFVAELTAALRIRSEDAVAL